MPAAMRTQQVSFRIPRRRLGLIMADPRRIMVPVELVSLRMLHCAVSAERCRWSLVSTAHVATGCTDESRFREHAVARLVPQKAGLARSSDNYRSDFCGQDICR